MSEVAWVDVREIENGGSGVPIPAYHCRFKGETLRIVTKAKDALEWLAHPYHSGAAYSVVSRINGVERVIQRGR